MTKEPMPDPQYTTPSEVANFFLEIGKREKVPITPMKLLKIIYIAYGWALGAENIRLFGEEIEAWKYGPVVPSVYHEFKHFGGNPIVDFLSQEYDAFEDVEARTPIISPDDTDVMDVLSFVWDLYKDKSATKLMRLTHIKDGPWDKVWRAHQNENYEINPEDIRTYYVVLLDKVLEDAA